MTSPFFSGLAVLVSGVLLSHCGGSSLSPGARHACLAAGAAGAIVPIDGYPLSALEDAVRKRGGQARMDGDILQLSTKDALTGRANVVRLEMQPVASAETSDQCGPKTTVVQRLAVNGQVATGLDMQDALFTLVHAAAQELGLAQPQMKAARDVAPYSPASARPVPIPPTEPGVSYTPPASAAAASYDDGPQMGNCHMGECSWSRTLSRAVQATSEGSIHRLTLLGGAGPDGDHVPSHVSWNAAPHHVTITCSLTHPSVASDGQVDDLALNTSGSSIPDVEMSSYDLYAGECHPEAKSLDPDALARRFGYRAAPAT